MLFEGSGLIAQSALPEEYYSINDGLSDRMISDIVQSPNGLLWIGTSNGLNRFDGYDFVVFSNTPSSPYKISDANIRNLALDRQGRLVITFNSSYGFFDLLDPTTYERITVRLLPDNGIHGTPRGIVLDEAGQIYAIAISSTHFQVYAYQGGQQFEEVFRVPVEKEERITHLALLPLRDGTFLLNDSENGLRHFGTNGDLLRHIQPEEVESDGEEGTYPGLTNIFHQDLSGKVWYALQGQRGLYHYLPTERQLEFSEQMPRWKRYTRLWEDQKGNLLLASSNNISTGFPIEGMTCIRPDGKQYPFDHLLNCSRYIVSACSHDYFENLVLGIDTGVKIVQNQQFKIQKLLADQVGFDQRGAVMRGITGNGTDEVYFAREVDAWYRFNPQTFELDTLQMIDEQTGEPVTLSCGRNIQISTDGYLWGLSCINGRNGRLLRYDRATCMVRTYLFSYKFTAFDIASNGLIWLVAEPDSPSGLLVSFDPETEQFTEYYDWEGNNPLSTASPRYILEARDGTLWAGTENGLYAIDPNTRQTRSYQTANHPGMASNIIYSIYEDEQNRLWLGTTNGFNIFDPKSGEWQHYNQQDALASNIVCGFVPAPDGKYWIPTYNGLSYFDPKQKTFRNFYREDGLSHNEFNRHSFYADRIGNIYLGGVNGMNIFRTEDLLREVATPAPILTFFSRYNDDLDSVITDISNLDTDQTFVLGPDDTQFTFQYTLSNFTTPRRNQFKTWLEGIDKGYIYQGRDNTSNFYNLPAGDYRLHVKGADANGNWSKEALMISLHVKPPWYKTYAFILSATLLTIIGLYFLFQYRLNRRLEMERMRTKLSSDLHDEVSGLLASIAMRTDILQFKTQDGENKKDLKWIGEVSRTAMSKMSDVIWSIDSRRDRFDDLLTRMKEHATEILAPQHIDYRFHVGKLDPNSKLKVDLRQNLYFIFKEAINNIGKHSWATEVQIRLYNEGSDFILHIEDNGREIRQQRNAPGNGDKADRQGATPTLLKERITSTKTGQGLSNIRMRAERIQAQLQLRESEKGFMVLVRCKKFA
ncbi:MAG: two-component regulator propeller domain-containing protein [Phaeodactylibacter sp.]|uniref:ligand-binding sensor domain-containing protein n=1 Tax=Phaeodactylibacter sp. TaxID=1940289 RepID=UPI0032EBF486